MKKIFTLVLVSILATGFAMAQTVEERVVEFQKAQANGFVINVAGIDSKSAVSAIQNYFKSINFGKSKNASGYVAYMGQSCEFIGTGKYDIYLSAIDKGKKKDASADIILICSLGYDNIISSASDSTTANNIKEFMLGKFPQAVEKYNAEKKIAELQKEVDKMNKEKEKNEKAMQKIKDAMDKNAKKQDGILKQIEEFSKLLK